MVYWVPAVMFWIARRDVGLGVAAGWDRSGRKPARGRAYRRPSGLRLEGRRGGPGGTPAGGGPVRAPWIGDQVAGQRLRRRLRSIGVGGAVLEVGAAGQALRIDGSVDQRAGACDRARAARRDHRWPGGRGERLIWAVGRAVAVDRVQAIVVGRAGRQARDRRVHRRRGACHCRRSGLTSPSRRSRWFRTRSRRSSTTHSGSRSRSASRPSSPQTSPDCPPQTEAAARS